MRYPHAKLRHLEERVTFLSEELYAAMEALDMALGLGAFPATIVTLRDRDAVLRETEEKIRTLMPFKGTAFYLVDEGDASFSLVRCYPEEWREFFERERPPWWRTAPSPGPWGAAGGSSWGPRTASSRSSSTPWPRPPA